MKRVTFFLLAFFFAINLSAQSKLEEGQKAFDKKDYKKAFTIAKDLLSAGDANGSNRLFIQLREVAYEPRQVYELLGDSYVKMGVNELAITNFEEAEKLDSLNIDLKFKTADLMIKQKKYTDAINKYLKIQVVDPKNSKAFLDAGNILFKAKLYPDAAKMYEGYLNLDKSKDAYENITKSFYEARNWEKTYEFGTKCVELYGTSPLISKYVATSALQTKKFEDAAKYYALVPDSLLSVNELERVGRTFQLVNDNANAMKYFEKVIKLDSTRSSIYLELANNFFKEKNYKEASKFYEAKINSDSTNELAWRYLGYSQFQFRDNADSNKANPNFKRNQLEKARVALLRSVELNKTDFTNRNFLITVYTELDSTQALLNQHKEMLNFIGNKEAEYKDQFIVSNHALGFNAYERKAWAAAIPYFLKVSKYKSDLSMLKILMSCYLQSGNNDEAINYARRILKASPSDKDAKKVLRALSAD